MFARALVIGVWCVATAACLGTNLHDTVAQLRPVSMQPDDDDGDGVPNYEDRCRLIRGYTVDGCPMSGQASRDDADFDGVDNHDDRCADESGVGPHGCPAETPGGTKTADTSYVLDRVTSDFPRQFASVAPRGGATMAFSGARTTDVEHGTYVTRFGPFASAEVAHVEYRRLVSALSRAKPSCCALESREVGARTHWSVIASEPAFAKLTMDASVEPSADGYDVVLRVGAIPAVHAQASF